MFLFYLFYFLKIFICIYCYFIYLFLNYFIVVQLQLSAFSPHPSLPPQPNPPPSLASTIPLGFVHVSFIVVPENPSPHYLLPSPLAIVRLFLTSMSLVIFCLLFSFVDYVPIKGRIIWYLSLTTWLISLSIMLSTSTHDGLLCSRKKEVIPTLCNSMDGTGEHYAE